MEETKSNAMDMDPRKGVRSISSLGELSGQGNANLAAILSRLALFHRLETLYVRTNVLFSVLSTYTIHVRTRQPQLKK